MQHVWVQHFLENPRPLQISNPPKKEKEKCLLSPTFVSRVGENKKKISPSKTGEVALCKSATYTISKPHPVPLNYTRLSVYAPKVLSASERPELVI
jgi:hypothetical protein